MQVGRIVEINELILILKISKENIIDIIKQMQNDFENEKRGIEIIKIDEGYQLCTKIKYYEYIHQIFDNRPKPVLSQAALETLSIIAYNTKITRSEIEAIRGVNSDGVIYKLLEYNLIEEAGKLDAPGKPNTYKITLDFLKMFGLKTIKELPELPKYKLNENQQIVVDDIVNEQTSEEGEKNEK